MHSGEELTSELGRGPNPSIARARDIEISRSRDVAMDNLIHVYHEACCRYTDLFHVS